MNTNGIVDILNALPISKLISTVSAGIGKMYEPRHKRKMADATAYEINAIGEAMRNAADLPIVYDQNGVAINSEDFNRLMQRAGTRLALQETIKQHNIESVVDNAYEILEKEEYCSAEPVEQGWINRFFDSVADISDEDLQKLWGKVLAGEIRQPRSYSLRTLETLKNLAKHEAQVFQKVLPFVIDGGGDKFIASKSSIHNKYGVTYEDIMLLDECGLIISNGTVSLTIIASEDTIIAHNTQHALIAEDIKEEKKFSFGIYSLTKAGKELLNILEYEPNNIYFSDFAENVFKENKHSNLTIQVIKNVNGSIVNTTGETVREFCDS